jgi:Ca-activated chloride channel family protein
MFFAQPHWLWALLLLPLAALAEAWATRRDRARTALLVARPLWPKVVRAPGARWRYPRLALLLAGAAGLVIALARPQWGIVREKIEREGVDVVLLLDTSGSMATEDVPPNRLQLAKTALLNLVQRLDGDRFALVAFEGDAYPLVPLTLDADAIGLFLETLEPGAVPTPGTSLGAGLARGLDAFADNARQNKVMVLVSDGEDLEGEVDEAVSRAKEAGVVVHTVAVGTPAGQPVPDFDRNGLPTGYKKDDTGAVVVSRVHAETLEAIARGTGGRAFLLTPADLSLGPLAASLEGIEQKALAREFSYRKKERFQVPLAIGLLALALALLLPPPERRRRARLAQAAAVALLLGARSAQAQSRVTDELLLRPTRLTAQGRKQYAEGNDPKAVEAFQKAAATRPGDARARFNLGDALYKSGKFDEAKAIYEPLAADARSPLAAPARHNLGNTLYQKQDYPGAIRAYRDALRLSPQDLDTRRNLELALRALQQQQQQQQDQKRDQKDQKKDQQQQGGGQKQDQRNPGQGGQSPQGTQGHKQERPKTAEERERERFEKETGMPKDRAMQLLDALQQNEKAEQRKLQAARQKDAPRRKDW